MMFRTLSSSNRNDGQSNCVYPGDVWKFVTRRNPGILFGRASMSTNNGLMLSTMWMNQVGLLYESSPASNHIEVAQCSSVSPFTYLLLHPCLCSENLGFSETTGINFSKDGPIAFVIWFFAHSFQAGLLN